MAQNPFNQSASTADVIGSPGATSDQFANFSQQNNPFNPQPPNPSSISGVTGNAFRLDMGKQSNMSVEGPAATGVVSPQDTTYGQTQTPTADTRSVIQASLSSAPGAQPSQVTQSVQSAQSQPQAGLIRGAIGQRTA